MGKTTTTQPIEYEVDSEIFKICPECKEEIDNLGPAMKCECGWEGGRRDVMTKRVSIIVKAVKKIEYLK